MISAVRQLICVFATLCVTASLLFGAQMASAPFLVDASVGGQTDFTVEIREELPNGSVSSNDVALFDFGNLVRDGQNPMRGAKAFHVFLTTNTSGKPYEIKTTLSALAKGGGVFLPKAVGIYPLKAAPLSDTSSLAGSVFLSGPTGAVADNLLIFKSNAAGVASLLELALGISGGNSDGTLPFPGWEPIPASQPAGTYSSVLTYTMSVI